MAPLLATMLAFCLPSPIPATVEEPAAVALVVGAGRPLRVALDARTRLTKAGQPVTGTLIEPVYAYDRIVIPAGTKARGHVVKLLGLSRGARAKAILRGDLTPLRLAVLEFDTLVAPDGTETKIRTEVRSAPVRITLQVRSGPQNDGAAAHAKSEIAGALGVDQARQALSAIKRPGRMRRLKDAAVGSLPYHPQYLDAGTVFIAALMAPLDAGAAPLTPAAEAGTLPAPESILRARLLTPLHSARTPKGTPVRAALIEPVFSADHRLLIPEGTILIGEVTRAQPARRFHRHGVLRFLFESVQVPEQAAARMRASLYSVRTGKADRIALDDEGGVRVTDSKARFAAPALSGLALVAAFHQHLDYDTDGLGPEVVSGSTASAGVGGFFGLGLLGTGLSLASRPVAVGLGVLGLVRSLFVSVLGKGRDVSFPADTVIEVQLGAGPPTAEAAP
jgi:hypothetical protein